MTDELRAHAILLQRQLDAITGEDIAHIRHSDGGIDLAKRVVNLKNAADWLIHAVCSPAAPGEDEMRKDITEEEWKLIESRRRKRELREAFNEGLEQACTALQTYAENAGNDTRLQLCLSELRNEIRSLAK